MQLVSTVPLEKVGQTMILFRDQKGDTRSLAGRIHLIVHFIDFRDWIKGGWNIAGGHLKSIRGKFHPHEKIVGILIGVVIGVENVAAEIVNESRYACNDALAIFTADQEHDRVLLP